MEITVPMIRDWEPCYDPTRYVNENWEGTIWDILGHTELSTKDKFWVVLREELLPADLLHEFACRCAEDVLHVFEKKYPNDDRPRKAIEAKRRYVEGKINKEELAAAREAAWSAARGAGAARDAAWAASDARDAARPAARDAARDAQLQTLKEMIHDWEVMSEGEGLDSKIKKLIKKSKGR